MNDGPEMLGEVNFERQPMTGLPPKKRGRPKQDAYDDINPDAKGNSLGSDPLGSKRGTRVPMSVPTLKLEVPEMPGYHLHWIRGDAARIQQAMRGGYEFVDQDEVNLFDTDLAGGALSSQGTDLGSRVSVLGSREIGEDGQAQRLYLMKIKQEWYDEDQLILEQRNEQIAAALRGGNVDSGPHGSENRYVPSRHKNAMTNIFTPKRRH